MKSIVAFVFLSVAAGALYFYYDFAQSPNSTLIKETVIDVPPGSSFSSLLKHLSEKGIIVPEIQAKIASRLLGMDKKVKVGEFLIGPPMSSLKILEHITSGRGILRNLLVKEGFNQWDIRDSWRQLPNFNEEEFFLILRDPSLLDRMRVPTTSQILSSTGLQNPEARNFRTLEGFLFPETYSIQKYDPVRRVIEEMLSQFDGRARPILEKHPWASTPLGFYRLVTLASIVEKESGNGEEQPLVASVFWNRLEKKMRLQSDPTTIYGLMPNFDGNLKRIHLETFSLFNTYRVPELPVGPICNPGEKALRAVLNPASTKFLYFVSRGDGTHIFAEDYKAHRENVQTFQLQN